MGLDPPRSVALVAILVGCVLPGRTDASCADGADEGWSQCLQYPGCECRSEVHPCPDGTWYTQYYVVLPCDQSTGSPPSTDGAQQLSRLREIEDIRREKRQQCLDNVAKGFLLCYVAAQKQLDTCKRLAADQSERYCTWMAMIGEKPPAARKAVYEQCVTEILKTGGKNWSDFRSASSSVGGLELDCDFYLQCCTNIRDRAESRCKEAAQRKRLGCEGQPP